MEMNETGQNCEEKADRQIIEKNEQISVNDSNCWSRLRSGFLRKPPAIFCPTPCGVGICPPGQLVIEAE